jgi:four helix bundle protein
MARPKDFRELIVWQKAMALARSIYAVTGDLPKKECYGMVAQMRRAAVSIPSNIAEGHGRLTDSQFRHFLGNARGSLYELQTQMELAGDLRYIETQVVHSLMGQGSEVARLINGLIASLNHRGAETSSANSASRELHR